MATNKAAITIGAHMKSSPKTIQLRTPSPTRPPANTKQITSVCHLADPVARRVRLGLTADPARAEGGGGTNGTGSCDGCPRSHTHNKVTGMPKAAPDARAATRAQPMPLLLAVATNTPTTTSAV